MFVAQSMKASMQLYKIDNTTQLVWDKMQIKMDCCGALSIDDWQNITWSEQSSCIAPHSCKIIETVNSGFRNDTANVTTILNNTECLTDFSQPHHSEVNEFIWQTQWNYTHILMIHAVGMFAEISWVYA